MQKRTWAIYIGHLIIAMNEVDWMTHIIQSKVLGTKISKSFSKKPLAERLTNLSSRLTSDDPDHLRIKNLLSQALDLCPTRNLVAHGSFALDGTQLLQPGQESIFLLHSLTHDQPASISNIGNPPEKERWS